MNRLALLTTMALLGIGLTLAQNTQSTKPLSDQSNSSNASTQPQSSEPTKDQNTGAMPNHQAGHEGKGDPAHSGMPDTTVRDEQNSTTSTTGAAGQDNSLPSRSTMGTTGSTPEASEPPQPQSGTSPDQQPNPSTQPDATTTPHAELLQAPTARAVATHTPDPGTCMNPASLQTSADGTAAAPQSCR